MNHQSSPSWQSSSKFKEHLSITVPPVNYPVAKSQFSPESPPVLPHIPSTNSSAQSRYHKKDIEAASRSPRPARSIKDRFTKFFFDMRMLGREPDMIPIQPRHVPVWRPLHIDKKRCPCHEEKNRYRKWWIIALVIVLLYLLADSVFLNVFLLSERKRDPFTTSTASPNASSTLSADAQQCISQYELNAPANPSQYPCSSCLPILQTIPSSFRFSNSQDAQQVLNAVQFCGLSAIFTETNPNGQSTLSNGGWLNDVSFCNWKGVSCDTSGRISSLELTFPGVPVVLPNELGSLQGLQSLQIIGNNGIPGGTLPASFTNLTSLSSLHLESSAITSIPDDTFTSLNAIATLTLVHNTQMNTNLPSSLGRTSLQNLIVNAQALTNPLAALASSSSLLSSLKLIDLSTTSLTGSIPASISGFSALTELHLDSNNLQGPLPPTFPPTLQALTLSNNTGITGSVPGTVCASSGLNTCDLRNTGLSFAGGVCGSCQLS